MKDPKKKPNHPGRWLLIAVVIVIFAGMPFFLLSMGEWLGMFETKANDWPPVASSSSPQQSPSSVETEAVDYAPGKLEGGVYTSEYYGLAYTIIDETTALDSEALTELLHQQPDTEQNQVTGELQLLGGEAEMTMLTEQLQMPMEPETYAEIARRGQSDYEWLDDGKLTAVTIAGLEFQRMSCRIPGGKADIQVDNYIYPKDDRMLLLAVAYTTDEAGKTKAEQLLAGFSALQ